MFNSIDGEIKTLCFYLEICHSCFLEFDHCMRKLQTTTYWQLKLQILLRESFTVKLLKNTVIT